MRNYRFALAVAFLSAIGCSGSTAPVGFTLPDPDPSLDPAALVSPTLLFVCNSWVGNTPPTEKSLFVDIFFGQRSADDPDDRPRSASIDAVERHGGQIVYRFHFPAVRAWMEASEIPALVKEGGVNVVFRVTNPRRYDWATFVGYKKPYSYLDGTARFEELGGRVTSSYNSINAIFGLIPDRSVTALRREAAVDYVSGGGYGCVD